jgi:hypothetical protein
MTYGRDEERTKKRAMTRSITAMIGAAEECVTGSGSIEIISERLPRGGWGTMMDRNPKTGQVDYSHQDDEAERVMARLLYRKLSQAVSEPGDIANVLLVNTISETSPEYMVPKMVTEVLAWSLYPADDGGFSATRLSPAQVQGLSPRDRYIREDLDEELGRLTGEHEEPRQTFEEFMAQPLCDSFDETEARLLTYEEKLAEWEHQQRRLRELDAGGGQYMPEDEVRYP